MRVTCVCYKMTTHQWEEVQNGKMFSTCETHCTWHVNKQATKASQMNNKTIVVNFSSYGQRLEHFLMKLQNSVWGELVCCVESRLVFST